MVYRGHVQNGVVVFDEPVSLPDGAAVFVERLTEPAGRSSNDIRQPSLLDVLRPLVGIADDLPEDGSLNVDHYLYGHPKKS